MRQERVRRSASDYSGDEESNKKREKRALSGRMLGGTGSQRRKGRREEMSWRPSHLPG